MLFSTAFTKPFLVIQGAGFFQSCFLHSRLQWCKTSRKRRTIKITFHFERVVKVRFHYFVCILQETTKTVLQHSINCITDSFSYKELTMPSFCIMIFKLLSTHPPVCKTGTTSGIKVLIGHTLNLCEIFSKLKLYAAYNRAEKTNWMIYFVTVPLVHITFRHTNASTSYPNSSDILRTLAVPCYGHQWQRVHE